MLRCLRILAVSSVAIALLASGLCGQQPDVGLPDGQSQPDEPAIASQEPKPELERPTVWGEPTEVRVLIKFWVSSFQSCWLCRPIKFWVSSF